MTSLNDLNIKQFDQNENEDDLGTLQIQQAVKKITRANCQKRYYRYAHEYFCIFVERTGSQKLGYLFLKLNNKIQTMLKHALNLLNY